MAAPGNIIYVKGVISINPKCTLSQEQVVALARPLVYMAEAIMDYYKDPAHEAAFQAWYLEKYGHPVPKDI